MKTMHSSSRKILLACLNNSKSKLFFFIFFFSSFVNKKKKKKKKRSIVFLDKELFNGRTHTQKKSMETAQETPVETPKSRHVLVTPLLIDWIRSSKAAGEDTNIVCTLIEERTTYLC